MLRSFRVENHKSIRDEAELLLMPAYDKTKLVVPVAAIFGANASGKSNVLDALRWMRDAVRTSFAAWEPSSGIPRHPFRLDPTFEREPSLFAIDLLLDGVRWMYGFVVDDTEVLEEWLYTYPLNRKRVVFERNGSDWVFGFGVPRAKAELVRDLTRGNALFLAVAARSELESSVPPYQWFQQQLTILRPTDTQSVHDIVELLGGSDQRRRRLVELVRAADLGVTDIRIRQDVFSMPVGPRGEEPSTSAELEIRHSEVFFVQGRHNVLMTLPEQSSGTVAWLRLLAPALTALEQGSVMCVDEIDSSIHPRLIPRLIELFKDGATNPHGAQLVFTTHDATLLGTSFGQEILRRDEIWFVEKDADGATSLFGLSEFHPRKEENTERRYLAGSYGAVPRVYSDTLVNTVESVVSDAA